MVVFSLVIFHNSRDVQVTNKKIHAVSSSRIPFCPIFGSTAPSRATLVTQVVPSSAAWRWISVCGRGGFLALPLRRQRFTPEPVRLAHYLMPRPVVEFQLVDSAHMSRRPVSRGGLAVRRLEPAIGKSEYLLSRGLGPTGQELRDGAGVLREVQYLLNARSPIQGVDLGQTALGLTYLVTM